MPRWTCCTRWRSGTHLPGFFTPYAYVRYLVDRPLRMTGPLAPADLRRSEQVSGLEPRADRANSPEDAAA